MLFQNRPSRHWRLLRDGGVKLFICSGRAPGIMNIVLDTIPVKFNGIVGLNGQYCVDDNGFLDKRPLAEADVTVILDWLTAHPDVVSDFCESDYVYFNHSNEILDATWRSLGKPRPRSTSPIRTNARKRMRRSRSAHTSTRKRKPNSLACAPTCVACAGTQTSWT